MTRSVKTMNAREPINPREPVRRRGQNAMTRTIAKKMTVTSADSVAHEFMEAITDAHLDAWYDRNGGEVADKCNYNYQACVELTTGSWQIQSEWSNAIGGCQQQ